MTTRFFPLVVFILLITLYGTFVQAYELPLHFSSSQTISVEADTLVYDWQNKRVLLKGNVLLKYDDLIVRAEQLFFDKKKLKFKAPGKVVIENDNFEILGRDCYVFLLKKKIHMKNAVINIPSEHIVIRGESIDINGKLIEVDNAYFTSCKCGNGTPFWEILSGKMKIEAGGYSWIFNGRINFLGTSVLWVPVLLLPAKYQKETGFLFPKFSISRRRGLEFHLPFYINVSPWSEGVLQFDYYSLKGFGLSGLYHYKLSETNGGSWSIKSVFGRGENFAELTGRHHYSGPSSHFSLTADMAVNTKARADFYDSTEKEGENYLVSSLEWKRFFKVGGIYGSLMGYQYLDTGKFSYLPSFGFFSPPIMGKLANGEIWARYDVPTGKWLDKRFLSGGSWSRSYIIGNLFSTNMNINYLFEVRNSRGGWKGEGKFFLFSHLKRNYGNIVHNLFLKVGYRLEAGDFPLPVVDGWDSTFNENGYFIMWNDRVKLPLFQLESKKYFFYGENSFFYGDVSFRAKWFSMYMGADYDFKKISNLNLFTSFGAPAGILSMGVFLYPGDESIFYPESFLFVPFMKEAGNGQFFFDFKRVFGRISLDVNGRWMLDSGGVFEQGIKFSYTTPCHCFSITFSYTRWPYRSSQTWSLWISFGRLGSISL